MTSTPRKTPPRRCCWRPRTTCSECSPASLSPTMNAPRSTTGRPPWARADRHTNPVRSCPTSARCPGHADALADRGRPARNRYLAIVKLEEFWALIQGSSTASKRQARERTEWLIFFFFFFFFFFFLGPGTSRIPAALCPRLDHPKRRRRLLLLPAMARGPRTPGPSKRAAGRPRLPCRVSRRPPPGPPPEPGLVRRRIAEWELINHVARNAYERATGEKDGLDNALGAQGLHRICDAAPQDDRWNYDDPGQRLARLPRLTALLG